MKGLSNKDKAEALSVYVNWLVSKKLLSTKKENRLHKDDYLKTLHKIAKVSINWVTFTPLKFQVLHSYNSLVKKIPPQPSNDIEVTTTSSAEDKPVLKIKGRPKGTTLLDLSIKEDMVALVKQEITVSYYKAIIQSDNNCNCLSKGTFNDIFQKTKSKFNLDDNFEFSYNACMKWIYQGKPNSLCSHPDSPLKDVEERFVQIILTLADIGCPVTVGETINLSINNGSFEGSGVMD